MKLRSKNRAKTDFSMASMTDIVFLLLIFFMINTNFVKNNILEINLPNSNSKPSQNEVVTVATTMDGKIYLGDKQIPLMALEKELLSELAKKNQTSFIYRGDEESKLKNMVDVMNIANKNKLKMVIATENE